MDSGGDSGDASGGDRWSGWAMQAVGTAGGHATQAVGTAGWQASRGGDGGHAMQAVVTARGKRWGPLTVMLFLAVGLVAVTPLQRYHVRSRT